MKGLSPTPAAHGAAVKCVLLAHPRDAKWAEELDALRAAFRIAPIPDRSPTPSGAEGRAAPTTS